MASTAKEAATAKVRGGRLAKNPVSHAATTLLDWILRLGENVDDHEGLQRNSQHGKGGGHRQSPRRQIGEKSGQPSRDRAGNVLMRGISLGIDRRHQPVGDMRPRRAERFVEVNGLDDLFADQFDMAREFGVLAQRLLDALAIAATQRAGRVPGQQRLDLAGLAIVARIACRVGARHGQPRSIPAIRHNSPSFLRA